jgi:hypothetical protein
LLLAAFVLVGVAGATALAFARDASEQRDERDDREEVRRLAGAFGEAYLSYDFQNVDASGDRVLALVTEAFAADFESTRAPGIEAVFADIETTTVARTTDVYIGDIGEATAQAYVIVDVDASNDAAGRQTLRGLSFLVTMAREDGEWKVDSVSPPPTPDVDGAATSTTTTSIAAG